MWAMGLAVGSGTITAAYGFANNIPNMVFELVAGGILSSLFIPTFLRVKEERGEEASWRFASHVFNLFVLILGAVAVVGTLWPEPFIWTQTFRSDPAAAEAVRAPAEFFFRFFAIQVVVYGGGTVIQGLLNAQRLYLWTALGPVFNNLIVIATMLIVATMPLDERGMSVLAIGTTLGVVTMFGVMAPALRKTGIRYTPSLGLSDPDVRRMLILAVPTVVYVITNIVAVSFRNASALAVSSNGPAILQFAWTFYQLPYGILAVALATAVFTEMSHAAGRDDLTAFRQTFLRGLRGTALFILPAAGLLVALATPLATLYLVGRFDPADVPAVASALRWWACGLVFFACMMFVLRAYYALRDTRTPMLVNLGTTVFQVGGYLALTTGLGAWKGFGINGIPITDGIFYVLQFIVLAALLRQRIGGFDTASLFSAFAKMALVSALAAAAAWLTAEAVGNADRAAAGALIQVICGGGVGLAVALAGARLARIEEVLQLTALFTRFASRLARRARKGSR